MSVLDYLLPQSFMSDVRTTFNPDDDDELNYPWNITNIFSGQSLAEGFERSGVYDFNPSMARPAELSTLRGIDPGSYSKEIGMKRGTLADALARKRAQTSQIGGGFAGYGQRRAAQNVAKQQFQTGVEGIYESVNEQRAGALKQLYSQLEDYGSVIDLMNQP